MKNSVAKSESRESAELATRGVVIAGKQIELVAKMAAAAMSPRNLATCWTPVSRAFIGIARVIKQLALVFLDTCFRLANRDDCGPLLPLSSDLAERLQNSDFLFPSRSPVRSRKATRVNGRLVYFFITSARDSPALEPRCFSLGSDKLPNTNR